MVDDMGTEQGLSRAYIERERYQYEPLSPLEDKVNHPRHYNSHPSGVECITVTEHMNFNIGNAVKYLWRADLKNGLEDLRKAEWYIRREIDRREKTMQSPAGPACV